MAKKSKDVEEKPKKKKIAEGVEKAVKKKSATQNDFTIHEGLQGIRAKPHMYLGDPGAPMAYRCIKEAVDNAYDEHIAGRNRVIEVVLDYDTGIYIIADQAGGIPTDFKKLESGEKISIMTAAYTKTHAGAKFNDKAYKTSAGTHGIGMSAVNAVSERMRVWTTYNDKLATQTYGKGRIVSKGSHPVVTKAVDKDVMSHLTDKLKKYGTIIALELDQTVVSEDAKNFKLPKGYRVAAPDAKDVGAWLNNVAMLNPGLEIRFATILKGKRKDALYINKKDLAFVPKQMCDLRELTPQGKPFIFRSDYVTCALVWSEHPDADHFLTFVNTSPTIDGGSHVTGFTAALVKAVKKHVPEKKPAKGKKGQGYTSSDLLIGLTGMFDWRMHGAAYTSQVKDKLSSKVDKEVEEILFPEFDKYFKDNPKVAKDIIKRALIMNKGREELAAVVKSMADVKKQGKGTLPVKLAQSPHCKPHERELFVVEGDSAKGPSVDARDTYCQEVLAAGGKPLNALKSSIANIIKHKDISAFLIAMGADIKTLDPKDERPKLSTDKLRIKSVLLLVDPDPDGGHIAVLYLAVIYRLLPDLFREGRVYCVQAPLYAALDAKGALYGGMTFEECRAKAPKTVKDQDIVRIKGWGEVGPEYIGPIAFDPKYRKLIRINPFAGPEQEQWFRAVVSEDAVNRRKLLGLEE